MGKVTEHRRVTLKYETRFFFFYRWDSARFLELWRNAYIRLRFTAVTALAPAGGIRSQLGGAVESIILPIFAACFRTYTFTV